MFRGVTSAFILWAVEVFGSVLGFVLVYVSFWVLWREFRKFVN